MQKEKEEKEKKHVSYYFRFDEFQQKFDDSIIASFESIKTINKKLNKTRYRNSKKPKKYNICNDMFKHFEKLLILVAITIL